MPRIVVKLKDGTKREFDDGATRSPNIKYEIGFVTITDLYGSKVTIPADQIQEVTEDAPRRGW